MWEPSGETLPPPNISSTSASFCASPPSIGIDHTVDGFPGTLADARNRVESGNQLPNAQEAFPGWMRSEEHTSELQSHSDLVCRLLLEKKKKKKKSNNKNKKKNRIRADKK